MRAAALCLTLSACSSAPAEPFGRLALSFPAAIAPAGAAEGLVLEISRGPHGDRIEYLQLGERRTGLSGRDTIIASEHSYMGEPTVQLFPGALSAVVLYDVLKPEAFAKFCPAEASGLAIGISQRGGGAPLGAVSTDPVRVHVVGSVVSASSTHFRLCRTLDYGPATIRPIKERSHVAQ